MSPLFGHWPNSDCTPPSNGHFGDSAVGWKLIYRSFVDQNANATG